MFPGQDKLMHFMAYTFIMLWFGFCYQPGNGYRNLGIGLITLGIALELIQGLMGSRSMELLDMLVNTVGIFIGWLLARTRLSLALIHVERIAIKRENRS